MTLPDRSPRITHLSWGRLGVEGHRTFKDAKLFPGGARAWDWRETGTDHVPESQPADVQEILDQGAEVVVLSTGMRGRLGVCPETLSLLKGAAVPWYVGTTRAAAQRYNDLATTERVGGLFHSTC